MVDNNKLFDNFIFMIYGTELTEFISIRQASKKLKITKQGVRKLIEKDELKPVYRVDHFYLIPLQTVEQFIKNRKSDNVTDGRYKIK